MPDRAGLDASLRTLGNELRRLEAEYNMFFAGQLPRPPWETRAAVERLLKRLDRAATGEGTPAERFRLQGIQARFQTFVDLWDRGQRAREEGRPGPFTRPRKREEPATATPGDRVVYVTTFVDPMDELDKLQELYERLSDARREVGAAQVPFHKFASLVRSEVRNLRNHGAPEVVLRVAVQDGHVALTARGLKGCEKEE
ncbi:MAG: hypothetical protein AB1806_18645 [Acidobacteriota bacterium]